MVFDGRIYLRECRHLKISEQRPLLAADKEHRWWNPPRSHSARNENLPPDFPARSSELLNLLYCLRTIIRLTLSVWHILRSRGICILPLLLAEQASPPSLTTFVPGSSASSRSCLDSRSCQLFTVMSRFCFRAGTEGATLPVKTSSFRVSVIPLCQNGALQTLCSDA